MTCPLEVIQLMIWEDNTPPPQVSERLESPCVRSVVFDPCANTPDSRDYLLTMERNLEARRQVFAPESPLSGVLTSAVHSGGTGLTARSLSDVYHKSVLASLCREEDNPGNTMASHVFLAGDDP